LSVLLHLKPRYCARWQTPLSSPHTLLFGTTRGEAEFEGLSTSGPIRTSRTGAGDDVQLIASDSTAGLVLRLPVRHGKGCGRIHRAAESTAISAPIQFTPPTLSSSNFVGSKCVLAAEAAPALGDICHSLSCVYRRYLSTFVRSVRTSHSIATPRNCTSARRPQLVSRGSGCPSQDTQI
jgi:hypothetical protein